MFSNYPPKRSRRQRRPVGPIQTRKKQFRPIVERLEGRLSPTNFRSIDGSGNNLGDFDEGQAGIRLFRIAPAAYGDGISTPAGASRPGARFISNTLSDQTDPSNPSQDLDIRNNLGLSDFIYVFGQFLDHDIDLTGGGTEQFDIPPGSPSDPMGTEPFTRSVFDPTTGTSTSNPRQQLNQITSWIDGSQIYGSDNDKASALRTHVGGRLKQQIETDGHGGFGNFLPYNNSTFFSTPIDMANDAHIVPDTSLFAAGDRRANENIQLTSMQTLFMREHNRIADIIHASNPGLSDETVYQLARRRVGAELQYITYNEWLPALLGPGALPNYTGDKPGVTADIANEFSTAIFRFAHSQLDNDIERKNNNGTDIADGSVDLAHAFFNPTLVNLAGVPDPFSGHISTGINPILKGAASANAQEVDLKAVRDIRNFLFGPPGAGGTDLIARDIQRGRDHGLTDYNSMRAAYGLPRVTSFAQISSDPAIQQGLQNVYGSVDNIDAFVGVLAEDHVPGADVGPLAKAVIVNQFTRLRDGDRFFFLNSNEFSFAEQQDIIAHSSLSQIIRRNTNLTNIQSNVFFFKATISGTVFHDLNLDGIREFGEPGLAGFIVDLHDDSGAIVASQTTNSSGFYEFTQQDLNGSGNYTVTVELPSGWTQNAAEIANDPGTLLVSRGGIDIDGANFGVSTTSMSPFGGGGGGPLAPQFGGGGGGPLAPSFGGGSQFGSGFVWDVFADNSKGHTV
jgi:peroxidase